MNGYNLSRIWFDFCFENPEKIKPNHTALYFFAIEHCNRLGWKEKYGLPTTMVKEAIGIKSYNTYINTLNDLVDWGFIKMIERSKNQYSANIIALSKFNKALDKALDKALIKHGSKQSESIDSIDKQLTIEQETIEQPKPFEKRHVEFSKWFYNQLHSNGIISRKSNPESKGWINPVKLLEERDSIEWEQIKKGALFYFKNHEEKFMPVIQSTTAFRDKWESLRTFLIKQQQE